MLKVNEIIEGEIQAMAFGGEGILRYHGFVVFVPFTAVGDLISCRITEVKRSFGKGVLVSLLKSSHDRTPPLCPYFGTCGGCQLQHLNEPAQLNYKLEAVLDALKRIGHLQLPSVDIEPATSKWAYRRHITLHLKPKGQGFEAGYIGQDHHSLVVVQTCPIFNEPFATILEELQVLVSQLDNPEKEEGRVILLKNHREQFIFSFQFRFLSSQNLKIMQDALQHSPFLAGVLVQTPKESISIGDPYCEQKFEGLNFRFSPRSFIQNHPEQSAKIYRQICRITGRLPPQKILDLYCGFGITTLLLSKQGHQVTGIECNSEAIKLAQENKALNHLKNVQFIEGDVEKLLPKWQNTHQSDFILVNPPRQGLAKRVVEVLLQAKPHHIVYVSCMPSTLARDLGILCQNTYEVHECTAYDMFPQTAHVETLVYLRKRNL